MVHLRLLLWFSLLAVADAFIQFDHSMIYDEFDFAGQKSLSVPLSCTETGCRIYISMPEASRSVANNLMIADKITLRTRFSDVSLMKQLDGQKGFYNIKKGNKFVNFTNQNADLISAPIMLWIIQGDAPHINDAQVYDATLFYRSPARAGLVTIMNAEPFTLTTDTRGLITVSAKLAGFEFFDDDTCTTVFEQIDSSTYQELDLSVRSPLITLMFDGVGFPDTTVAMTAKLELADTFELSKPMFATSSGYVCAGNERREGNGTMNFRSSLYNDDVDYRFVSDSAIQVGLSADMNLAVGFPINITDCSTGEEYKWWGSKDGGTSEHSMEIRTNDITISWTRDDDESDQYFLIRIVPDFGPDRTTTSIPETDNAQSTTPQQETTLDGSTSEYQSAGTTAATRRTKRATTSSQKPSLTSSRPIMSTTLSSSTTTSSLQTTTSSAAQDSIILAVVSACLLL